MFLVGGGGAADGGYADSYSYSYSSYADSSYAGSSGFFMHQTFVVHQTQSFVLEVIVGKGGTYGGDGQSTEVRGLYTSPSSLLARGGGGAGRDGWSGGSGGGGSGGANGSNGHGQNGSGEALPTVCGVELAPGDSGTNSSDGEGGGGVIVDGQKPTRNHYQDGEGFGAGGGEDNLSGYPGVVVLSLC